MSADPVVVLARAGRAPVAETSDVWAPLRWALLYAVATGAPVRLVLVTGRRRGAREAELLTVLDGVRAELPQADLSVRAVKRLRPAMVAELTAHAQLLVVGGGGGLRTPFAAAVATSRCPAVTVAGGGVPTPTPPASGTRQEPSPEVPGRLSLPNVD